MDSSALLVALAALALGSLLGCCLGWFIGGRPASEWKARHGEAEAKAREWEGQFRQAAAELGRSQIENATLKANVENFDKQIALLNQAREDLLTQFRATGGEVLAKAQEQFLQTAAERLGHAEKASEQKIKALLEPVGQQLDNYRKQVAELETRRVDDFGSLRAQIAEMQKGQEAVKREAQRLGDSLRNAPKARGRWGEQQLKNVLEQCGLAQHTDFVTEHSVEAENGRLRPDAIVRIPGNRLLVIDAKVSLNAYQAAFEADDDGARKAALDDHARSMRTHVQQLGAKGYQSQFEEAPDYVVMFVPGEHFVAAALEHDPELWDFAFRNNVLLATPTNLVAIARTVAQVWRQDELAREAKEIGRIGTELYDRLAKVTEDLGKLGTHLGRAVSSYNEFSSSFNSRLVVSARRMQEKGIEIGKREIEDAPLVESAPRLVVEEGSAREGDVAA